MNTARVKKKTLRIANAFVPSLISVVGGLIIGFIILFIINPGSSFCFSL